MSRPLAWHIFRKDWRLMWPLAVGVAVTQVLIMAVIRHSEPFPMPEAKSAVAALLTFGLAVGMTLLILLTVQQEAIPSIDQDWLTRPVKRGDLLGAKLLALLLLVHGPIVLVNVAQGLAEGFTRGSVLLASLDSNFEVALCYTLPAMAIAAMTRSVVQAIVFGLVVALIVALAGVVVDSQTEDTGLKWIWRTASHAELLLVTIAALMWQYFRRDTWRARGLFVAGVVLFALIPALPWGPAFSIQRVFATEPQLSRPIAIRLARDEPEQGGLDNTFGPGKVGIVAINLPLRFAEVPPGVRVRIDRAVVRLVRGDDTVVYEGLGQVSSWPHDPARKFTLVLEIPDKVYSRVADTQVRMELEYYLTLLRGRVVSPTLPLDDARRLPGFGWCATRVDAKMIEAGCRQIGALPFCVSMAAGHGPETFVCELNYEPVPLRFSVDPIDHVEASLPMPVEEDLQTAQVTVRVYEPVDHFYRQMLLARTRLKDWARTHP